MAGILDYLGLGGGGYGVLGSNSARTPVFNTTGVDTGYYTPPSAYDAYDRAAALKRAATLESQQPVPFSGMIDPTGAFKQGAFTGNNAPALPPPINIANLPVAQPQIPVAPKPAQYTPQPTSPIAPQNPQTAPQSPGGYSVSDFLGGIKGGLVNALSIMNPDAGKAYLQRQIMQIALPQLLQQTGGDLPKAMALLQNPKLQEQIYGNPTSLGSVKVGNVELPAYAQGGHVGYAIPNGNGGQALGNLIQFGNDVTRSNAAAEATGKAQGTNAAALPQALAQADQAIALIDNIKKDPGLPEAVGAIAGRLPAIGGQQANVIAKIDQLKGQAFLQAWQSLKGSGARITNTESMRATDAIGRLQRSQTLQGFNQALDDLRSVIVGVRTRAGQLAGGQPTPPPQASAAPSFTQDQLRAEAIRRGLIKQ